MWGEGVCRGLVVYRVEPWRNQILTEWRIGAMISLYSPSMTILLDFHFIILLPLTSAAVSAPSADRLERKQE